jgi:hypothetical protein
VVDSNGFLQKALSDDGLHPNAKAYAVMRPLGLDPERTFQMFCNHWRSAPEGKARKRDWDRAFQNWCFREYTGKARSSRYSLPAADLQAVEAWEKLVTSNGKDRDVRVDVALRKIGGFARWQQRTERDAPFIRRAFIDAYQESA